MLREPTRRVRGRADVERGVPWDGAEDVDCVESGDGFGLDTVGGDGGGGGHTCGFRGGWHGKLLGEVVVLNLLLSSAVPLKAFRISL